MSAVPTRFVGIGTLEASPEVLNRLQRGSPVGRDLKRGAVVGIIDPRRPPDPAMRQQVWSDAGLLILAEKERTIVEEWGVADVEFVRVQLISAKTSRSKRDFGW